MAIKQVLEQLRVLLMFLNKMYQHLIKLTARVTHLMRRYHSLYTGCVQPSPLAIEAKTQVCIVWEVKSFFNSHSMYTRVLAEVTSQAQRGITTP